MYVAATRVQVGERTAALEERLTRLHRQLGRLADELVEVQAHVRAGLAELDELRDAQTAHGHAVDAQLHAD